MCTLWLLRALSISIVDLPIWNTPVCFLTLQIEKVLGALYDTIWIRWSGAICSCNHSIIVNARLYAELRKRGQSGFRDAVLLETIGRASIAWTRTSYDAEWRQRALHVCNLLVLRIFGRAIRDVGVLRRRREDGLCFTTNQLLDLVAITEARQHYLQQPEEHETFKETVLTTRYLESSFSFLTANMGSGKKLPQCDIQGKVGNTDALLALKLQENLSHTIPESKRKRKFGESSDSLWGQTSTENTVHQFDKDMCRRVRGYIGGRAPTTRDHNAAAGGVGKR